MRHLLISPRLPIALLVTVAHLLAADGSRDPEFDKVPFAQWLAGSEQTQLRWTNHVLPVVLSVHQRLMARVQVQLDGAEAAKRRGEGELIFYFQIADSQGRTFQDHTSYDLTKVEEGLKAQDLVCTESAFVLPGDYAVSVAIYDTATKEHSVKKTKLHVAPMKIDPLPDTWRNLPAVEFIDPTEPPDRWFYPKLKGKLNLPLTPRRPVRIEVLVNLTPSQRSPLAYGVQDRNFSFILPSLKVISQMTAPGLMLNAAMLDLSRRRITYRQDDVHDLDWDKMKASLSEANSGSIDVKSLADRQHNAAFFLTEIERRLAGEAHAVIVFSGPMVFETEQELPQPQKSSPECRLFYVRVQSPAVRAPVTSRGTNGRRGLGGGFPGRSRTSPGGEFSPSNETDQLLPMLKALEPHSFDVMSAEQFRKALAQIMTEISTL